jgi:hypothetical protein
VATAFPGWQLAVDRVVESPVERFTTVSRGFGDSEASLGANSRAVGSGG